MLCKQVIQPIVIQPQGSLDRKNAAAFQQWIANILLSSPTLCVLDMSHLDFIDCSGLFSLMTGLTAARQQQCCLAICNLQPPVRMTLEIIQLDREIDIFESLEAVLTTLN
ncbi:MAG: hypothetical protein CLLPBCKN_000917 [Chroococcidiopsis cubana SAG 39.79]|uniref:Anti-sigma factor antagonist n=1 Tax=Chroococcidiopsis cubana SAG 39.79 TaxID=388085 RepID=A0AB37UC49_9CYAN|nr:STAS domain-containing protein [Chroococcidiopsis cubana]MDZ4871529.1 hypothetical protein [Chroococcidiopsis cubana SAG 39.79]PSB64742.1 anti-anti-sigma factor [Chroococcidiopsis cubana CCALA 043]RUT04175.1 hypothetical protein DSM107010_58510 [Chroococcidiopsis cubana SAG 39.79]